MKTPPQNQALFEQKEQELTKTNKVRFDGVFTKRWSKLNNYQKLWFVALIYALIASLVSLYLLLNTIGAEDMYTTDKTWLYLLWSAVLVVNIPNILEWYHTKKKESKND